MDLTRLEFLRKLMRFALLAILSLIVFALGNRVVTAQDCSACQIKNSCRSKTDCAKNQPVR